MNDATLKAYNEAPERLHNALSAVWVVAEKLSHDDRVEAAGIWDNSFGMNSEFAKLKMQIAFIERLASSAAGVYVSNYEPSDPTMKKACQAIQQAIKDETGWVSEITA